MTIEIIETTVNITGNKVIGFALNNLVDHFEATVDTSADWFYQLKIYMTKVDKYNIINLDRNGNVLSVDLTRHMLPFGGRYIMQFVGYNDAQTYQTETFEGPPGAKSATTLAFEVIRCN